VERDAVIDLLKRYYWGLNLIVIGVSAYFAARASLHVVEAKYLLGEGSQKPSVTRRLPPLTPKLAHSKETRAILERNMFCSDCPPIIPKEHGPEGDDKKGQEIKSNLPLQLVATLVSPDPEWSFAVIKDTQGREATNDKGQLTKVFPFAMYSHGHKISGHEARLERVEERRVYLQVSDHIEYIDLQGVAGQEKTLASARPPMPGAPPHADYGKGVRKVSETQYEIDRNMLEKVLSDTNAIARSARVVPSVSPKDGKPNGFKLYAIRPDSVYSTIGLQNGDTVSAINGQEINSPEKAFELYAKLRTASGLQISIIRRGQPMTIDYSIR
jgi:general secretion pathway protein C